VIVPSTRQTLPFTISRAYPADGTNCSRTDFTSGDDGGDDPRYCRLRDSLHVTEEFLYHIMPQVHARDLHRSVQAA
jgi:hypothetical protein